MLSAMLLLSFLIFFQFWQQASGGQLENISHWLKIFHFWNFNFDIQGIWFCASFWPLGNFPPPALKWMYWRDCFLCLYCIVCTIFHCLIRNMWVESYYFTVNLKKEETNGWRNLSPELLWEDCEGVTSFVTRVAVAPWSPWSAKA